MVRRRLLTVLPMLALLFAGLAAVPSATARSAPNLKVAAVSVTATTVQQFDAFVIKDTVIRAGRVPRGLEVQYVLSLDGVRDGSDVPLLGRHTIPAGPGRASVSTTVTTFGLTPPGSYRVLACADPGRELAESSEKDNCRATSSTVRIGAVQRQVHNVSATLATARAKVRQVFLHDRFQWGTGAAAVTAAGPDGTRYTLKLPRDAALMALRLEITPVAGVTGLPGSPRVLGVKITPESDLLAPATLTIDPAGAVSAKSALPAAYDGDGASIGLTPMTPHDGVFTFRVTHLGGYVLIVPGTSGRPLGARQSGGMDLKRLYSWTPTDTTRENAADTETFLDFKRQQGYAGIEWSAAGQHAFLAQYLDRLFENLRAEIAQVDADPTIGNWDGLVRMYLGVLRQMQLLGTSNEAVDARLREQLPAIHAVYAKVLAGLHACDDGMADVLGLVSAHASADLGDLLELPADPSEACTRYAAHVDVSDQGFDDDEFQRSYSYGATMRWTPKSILDYGDHLEPADYTAGEWIDVCERTTGDPSPDQPWNLEGLTVDWDGLFQRGAPQWEDPRAFATLDVDFGSGTQPMVSTDDDCTGGIVGPAIWGPGPERHIRLRLSYDQGRMVGDHLVDHRDGGTWEHEQMTYDVTAVP